MELERRMELAKGAHPVMGCCIGCAEPYCYVGIISDTPYFTPLWYFLNFVS
jgi:hypothetical protein